MEYIIVWVAAATGVGLLFGYALSVSQFALTMLVTIGLLTSAAIYKNASFWAWGPAFICVAIAAQIGYVFALGLRAYLLSKRLKNSPCQDDI